MCCRQQSHLYTCSARRNKQLKIMGKKDGSRETGVVLWLKCDEIAGRLAAGSDDSHSHSKSK